MRIKLETIILIGFGIVFFTGFQGAKYFFSNRLQELGLLIALMLFFYSAFMASLKVKDKDLRWNWWFFTTLLFVCYKFFVPAYVFSENANVAMMPSVAAAREVLIVFFGPAIYFIYRLGLPIEKIEKVFALVMGILVFNYLFHYFRFDLAALNRSPDYALNGLVTFDPWRGYRLKPTSIAMFTVTTLGPYMLYLSKTLRDKLFWFAVVAGTLTFWAVFQARSMGASLMMGMIMFPLFFVRKRNMGLFFLSFPFIFALLFGGIMLMVDHMQNSADGVRLRSFQIAIENIIDNPFFGYGQQSNFTKTEQDIFWYKFYSSDIGLTGMACRFGLVGAFIYLFFSFFVIQRMIRTIWLYKKAYGQIHPIFLSIYVVMIALTLNLMLNPALGYIGGFTLASYAIATSSVWQHKIKKEFGSNL
jgi:hypothetical protein